MCQGDDKNCPDFEEHRQNFLNTMDLERRSFLKSAFAAAGGAGVLGAGGLSLVTPSMAAAAQALQPERTDHYHLPATADTVHWGYFSKSLPARVEISPGDYVTIETLTHHANDDAERMVKGDPGAQSVFHWSKDKKNVDRRGAGPMDASLFGRGAGEGLGVHICTGPVAIRGAEPGDVLEVRIIDMKPRPSANPEFAGKTFGSNAAAWWGYQYKDLLTEPKPREVVTIYEIDARGERNWAKAVYNFRWTPQTDPFGVVHKIIDYPGVPVDHSTITKNFDVLKGIRIPVRPHFGVLAVAPKEAEMVDSIPPGYFGGNMDNWRLARVPPCITRSPFPERCSRRAIRMPRRGIRNCAALPSSAPSPGLSSSSCTRRPICAAPLWKDWTSPCWKPLTTGSCTASAIPITWSSWATRRSRSSMRSHRSISPCATPSARCASS